MSCVWYVFVLQAIIGMKCIEQYGSYSAGRRVCKFYCRFSMIRPVSKCVSAKETVSSLKWSFPNLGVVVYSQRALVLKYLKTCCASAIVIRFTETFHSRLVVLCSEIYSLFSVLIVDFCYFILMRHKQCLPKSSGCIPRFVDKALKLRWFCSSCLSFLRVSLMQVSWSQLFGWIWSLSFVACGISAI